jgi:hypothetical protein
MIEVVRGTVIGQSTFPYSFFTLRGKRITDIEWFKDDAEAIEWFRVTYPKEFKAGAEMRCYKG